MYEGRCSFGSAMKRQTPAITFPLFKFNHSFSSASKGESFFAPDWANLLYSDADEPLQPPLVSPISLQLSALNRFPSHWGWISLGPLNGFSRLLNRFLGIGSNFSHSRVAVTRVGFNIQPGGHFKEWHCTITAWFILIRRLGFRWIRFKRNVFFSQGNDLAG